MKSHRVRLRPKARSRRRSKLKKGGSAFGAAALLGAIVLARPWTRVTLPPAESLPLAEKLAVARVSVRGIPEELAASVRSGLDWTPGAVWGAGRAGREAEALKKAFPFLSEVRARRSWGLHEVVFDAALRRPVARVIDADRGVFLGSDGTVFPAPEGFPGAEGRPAVRLKGEDDRDRLAGLAVLIRAASEEGALPSPLAEAAWEDGPGSLSLGLADGTRVLWGRLQWTAGKLARLREVLADAGPRFSEALTADLTHFEDGRILIRKRRPPHDGARVPVAPAGVFGGSSGRL